MEDKLDVGEIRRSFDTLFPQGGVVEVRIFGALPRYEKAVVAGYYDDYGKAATDIANRPSAKTVYVTLNEVNPDLLARINNRLKEDAKDLTADQHIVRRRWMLVDCDPVRPVGIPSNEEEHSRAIVVCRQIVTHLKSLGWPSPVLGDSGNGGHLLYALDLPNDDASRNLIEKCLKALALQFDDPEGGDSRVRVKVDTSTFNASRVSKLYGTWAKKGDGAGDRQVRLSKILVTPKSLVVVPLEKLEQLAELAPAEMPRSAPMPRRTDTSTTSNAYRTNGPFDLDAFIDKYGLSPGPEMEHKGGIKRQLDCPFNPDHRSPDAMIGVTANGAAFFKCSHNSCSDKDWYALSELLDPGVTARREEARQRFATSSGGYAVNNSFSRPQQATRAASAPSPSEGVDSFAHDQPEAGESLRAMQAAHEEAERKKAEARAKRRELAMNAEGLPAIETTDRHTREASKQVFEAIVAKNDPPTIFIRAGELVRVDIHDRATIRLIDLDRLSYTVARVANCVSTSKNRGTVPVHPPQAILRDILQYPNWPGIADIEGIVTAPVVGIDGELLTEPGYLPNARVFYSESTGFVLPDTTPTEASVKDALDLLLGDLFGDFPFVDDASRANALGLLLLPFVRPYIRGSTPFHIIDAPTKGTGKSLLARVSMIVYYGREPSAMGAPSAREKEEWRKLISAQLDEGGPFFFLDNISGVLQSPDLELALTAQTFTGRRTGFGTMIEAPVRCVFVGTANNVQIGGDLDRRTTWIRLDSKVERPETRTGFKIADIAGYAIDNRPRLVAACLTLIRAWIERGRPKWSKPGIGSFEGWSQTIGGILDVVGVPDFQANREEMYDRFDPVKDQWSAFVQAWFSELKMERVGVKDLAAIAVRSDIIDEDDKRGRTLLGAMLRGKVDQLFSLDAAKTRVRLAMDGKKAGAAQYRLCYGETARLDFEGDGSATREPSEPSEPFSASSPTLVSENDEEGRLWPERDDENREPMNLREPPTTLRVGVQNENITPTRTIATGSSRFTGSLSADSSVNSPMGSSADSYSSLDASFEEGRIEEIGFSETADFGSGEFDAFDDFETDDLSDPFED